MKEPKTPAEWQEVVDLAEACLLIDSARQYGLITGGPDIHVDRCVTLLARGRKRGIAPNGDGVEAAIAVLIRAQARPMDT